LTTESEIGGRFEDAANDDDDKNKITTESILAFSVTCVIFYAIDLSVLLAVLISATGLDGRSVVRFHLNYPTIRGKLYLSKDPVSELVPLKRAELWDRVCQETVMLVCRSVCRIVVEQMHATVFCPLWCNRERPSMQ
jgi:hypothetical protein